MSTYMAKPETVTRKWYVIDAAGKPLGRIASDVATLLRGKHKTTFTPHVDCGDNVIVVNASKVILTGNKLHDKMYRTHSGYIGALKEVRYEKIMAERPDFAFMLAVKGMLPKNSIGRTSLKRLHVYKGAEHKNAAQKPEVFESKVGGNA